MDFFTREFFSKVPRELFNFPAITSILYLSPVLQVFCKWQKRDSDESWFLWAWKTQPSPTGTFLWLVQGMLLDAALILHVECGLLCRGQAQNFSLAGIHINKL